MKKGITEAKEYLTNIRIALGNRLVDPNSIYHGKQGHLRLARECGYALNDFNDEGRREILSASYSSIYITGCNLKPILDDKDWINEMSKQIK